MASPPAPNAMFYASANESTADVHVVEPVDCIDPERDSFERNMVVRGLSHREGPYAHRHHVLSSADEVDLAQTAYVHDTSNHDDPFATPLGTPAQESVITFPSQSRMQSQANLNIGGSEAPSFPNSPLASSAHLPANFTTLVGGTTSRLSMLSNGFNFGSLPNGSSVVPNPSLSRVSTSTSLVGMAVTSGSSDVPPVPRIPFRTDAGGSLGIDEKSAPPSRPPGYRESFAAPLPMQYRPLTSTVPRSRRASLMAGSIHKDISPASFAAMASTKLAAVPDANEPSGKLKDRLRPSTALFENQVIEKPWLTAKNTRGRISWWLTMTVGFVGVIGTFLRCFFGARGVQMLQGNLCLVLEDDFNSAVGQGINTDVWSWEVDLSGYGNGEFEMTTASSNNSFVEDGILYLVPTLTSDVLGTQAIFDGHTFNLTGCTNLNATGCGVVSNETTRTVINPVQSARLTTINSTSIRYGKVEVRAKIPRGDWIWPAIWMLPLDNAYGPWPLSGEIDIMESRGNDLSYTQQGRNYVRGSLNWGPLTWLNEVSKTFSWWNQRRRGYDEDFHLYTLEWSPKFIRAYVDTRLHFMVDVSFDETFFERGDFPPSVFNGSTEIPVPNPWPPGNKVAPFDQSFYLIMDVAVGGTNGWFPDGAGGKPWLDQSTTAMYDFARAQEQWYSTWPTDPKQRGMAVDYVKMWQLC